MCGVWWCLVSVSVCNVWCVVCVRALCVCVHGVSRARPSTCDTQPQVPTLSHTCQHSATRADTQPHVPPLSHTCRDRCCCNQRRQQAEEMAGKQNNTYLKLKPKKTQSKKAHAEATELAGLAKNACLVRTSSEHRGRARARGGAPRVRTRRLCVSQPPGACSHGRGSAAPATGLAPGTQR